MKIGRNDPCSCGSGKKYKRCCLAKDEKKEHLRQKVEKMTYRELFIHGPYKKCPGCLAEDAFGVSVQVEGSDAYSRECIKCGHQETFDLPKIKKKILYLDQFVISNLVKLLDKSHPSHERIKADPFWEALFTKLEVASKSQAIICPDSFYHQDESLIGNTDFGLMQRLYEHFSNGKTLYPMVVIERRQVVQHFESWLENKGVNFEFKPEDIAFGEDLHSWSVGLRVSVRHRPYPGQLENLQKTNAMTKEELKDVWMRWQAERNIKFVKRVEEETLGIGKGLMGAAKQFIERKVSAMARLASGEDYKLELDDFLPLLSNDILEDIFKICQKNGLLGTQIAETIIKYFNDVDALLEIPQIRIGSVMFAGLAHRAANGKKNPLKSITDVQFISSYLPYCDALFVDKESASLLREFPKNTPSHLRLKEFSAKVFSLSNKYKFLDYLDRLVTEIPEEQINILKDMTGENYAKPYWGIIDDEKDKLNDLRK